MLKLAICLMLNPMILTRDPVKPAFRAAASAVLDSASAWAPAAVGRASNVIVDGASFQTAAAQIGAVGEDWTGFASAVRPSAQDRRLDQAQVCIGSSVRPSCTLPIGTILVRADSVSQRNGQITLSISVQWPHGRLMGRAVYSVILRSGRIVSVEQTLRT